MMMNNMVHMARMMMVRRRKHLLQSRVVDDDVCKIGIDGEDDANDDVDGVMVDFVINWDVGQLIGDAEHFLVCKNIKILYPSLISYNWAIRMPYFTFIYPIYQALS